MTVGREQESCFTKDYRTVNTSDFSVLTPSNFAKGHSQRKDVSPLIVNFANKEIKFVKIVSCVTRLSFVKPIRNV